MISLTTQELAQAAKTLRAGDRILLSGDVYTARDAAHKRFEALLDKGESLPFELLGAAIYYAGPTAAKPGMPIGSCGPTTSSRMDVYSPRLVKLGLTAMIGKGERSDDVMKAICENGAVYLCATGGAGALAARCVQECKVVAFEDLGCESVKRLRIKEFPLVVGCDCMGGNVFARK